MKTTSHSVCAAAWAGCVLACGLLANPASAQPCSLHESFRIVASDGQSNDHFGTAVAINEDWIVVGTSHYEPDLPSRGSFYVFHASTGEEVSEFQPDGVAKDSFGWSIAIEGSLVYGGAPYDDASGHYSGSVYIYDAERKQQVGKLVPGDGSAGDAFGLSVSIDNSIALIGAPGDDNLIGSAYLFDLNTNEQLAKITPENTPHFGNFGMNTAIDGTRALITTTGNWVPGDSAVSPAAYLYDITDPSQPTLIKTIDFDSMGRLGIAINGHSALVGNTDSYEDTRRHGQVHVLDSDTGQHLNTIHPSGISQIQQIGWQVDLSGSLAVLGDYENNINGDYAGAAYIHDVLSGRKLGTLFASDSAENGIFGTSVAIHGSTAVVGAAGRPNNDRFGAVYVFDLNDLPCLGDFTCDGILDSSDAAEYFNAFLIQSLDADFTGDGVLNIFDVFSYLEVFNAGCS